MDIETLTFLIVLQASNDANQDTPDAMKQTKEKVLTIRPLIDALRVLVTKRRKP